jgi:hypothetical protein
LGVGIALFLSPSLLLPASRCPPPLERRGARALNLDLALRHPWLVHVQLQALQSSARGAMLGLLARAAISSAAIM